MSKRLIRAAGLAFALGMSATASFSESLAGALAHAYEHSGLLQQNRALLRAADEDVASATAALQPVISYTLGGTYSSVTQDISKNLGISASLTLFDGGTRALRRDVARENVLSMREALRAVEQNVLLQAATSYVSVLRDSAIVALRENNLRLLEQELRAANDRFDVGEVTRTDVSLAEARLAAARSALAAARGALERSREDYRANVGEYPGDLQPLPALPATAKSQDEATAIARMRHPDIAQAQRSVNVAELNIDLAAAAMKPRLTSSASGTHGFDGTDSLSLGLSVSGPIYQGGALASAARKAAAQRDASRAGLHVTRHNVDRGVGIAWSQLEVAEAGLRASDEQVRAARVAFQGTREEASLGARTTLDVLNAEQELLDAEASRISAETDRYIAVYTLLASMGLLSADHLGLAVTRYDPEAYYNAVSSAPVENISPQGQKLDHILEALGKR